MRRALFCAAAAIAALALIACDDHGEADHGGGGGHAGHPVGADAGGEGGHAAGPTPEVWDAPVHEGPWEVSRIEDRNPAEDVVEVELVARPAEVEYLPGRTTTVWTYNGTVPGPVIEARVGDRLMVHFRNELPEETTIHWHGLRVPAEMDGVPAMQTPVPPGGTFDYEFVVPDAGTFWYHPHVRSDEQVERGLYGSIVVRAPDELAFETERVVVLDDVLVDAEGALASFEYDLAAGPMGPAMIGRQGNVILVNGRARPRASFRPGEQQRWRLTNAANARYFRLALPGHRLVVIGTDGGLLEAPREVDELLLVPGERADVIVSAPVEPGAALDLVTLPYDRGHGTGEAPQANVLVVSTTDEAPVEPRALPAELRRIEPLPAPTRTRTFELSEEHGGGGDDHGAHGGGADGMGPVFRINGEAFPDITPLVAELGAVEEWTITNDSEMDHPFHLHGFFFQVISRDGVAEPPAWKDTVNLRGMEQLVLRVRFDDHPGRWMYHCHILEHAERGMMGELNVTSGEEPEPEPEPEPDPHGGH